MHIRIGQPPFLAMLDNGARLDLQDNRGNTSLHTALSCHAELAVILAMLKKGARLDVQNNDGATPLHIAFSCHAAPAVILAMLDNGARLDLQDNRGNTPLHEALSYRATPEVILAMLKKGAPLNVQNKFGITPLHTALIHNTSDEVILAMVEKGAPLHVQHNRGDTPLQLLFRATEQALKESYANALIMVIERDKAVYETLETVDLTAKILSVIHPKLTQHGPIDAEGNTILHALLKNNYPSNVVAAFLEDGARTNIPNQAGETAMSIGLSDQVSAEIQALFQAHADAVA